MPTLIKVGGSLLSLPDLAVRMQGLIERLEDEQVALLIGGGEAADAVRQWDRVFPLDPQTSHQLAIDAMGLTASLVTRLITNSVLCRCRADVEAAWSEGRVAVLEPASVVAKFERLGCEPLPAGWHVTSDSIAGWLAAHWPFERLVLAKSVEAPSDLSEGNVVDEFFPSLLRRLPGVFWCNLRADRLTFAECKTR